MKTKWSKIQTPHQRVAVAAFFECVEISLARTFLQGYGGQAWCDCLENPRFAVIKCQGILIFGGDFSDPRASEFAAFLPHENNEWYIFCNDNGWLPLIENAHPGQTRRYTRYSMNCDATTFDLDQLRRFVQDIPPEYEIVPIDKAYYEQAMSEEWSREFCSFFSSEEDFLKNGVGFCAVYRGRMVAGASTFSIFDGGIEVQIETHSKHQRRGLATACGAALILTCLAQNRQPCWDAISEPSRDLALKLGYTLRQSYTALLIETPPLPSTPESPSF